MRSVAPGVLLVACLALGAGACARPHTVRTETYASSDNRSLDIRKVAIAPFRVAASYRQVTERDPDPQAAARLIERFVAEALAARGVEVVPAGDLRTALGLEDPQAAPPPLRIVAEVAHREFGVPALVYGTVYRIRERTGEALATAKPASVWFEVTMVRAPGGTRLWQGVFNETQQPLNENLLNARRYPGGGTRWLRAEELAQWGAREVAREFPTSLPQLPSGPLGNLRP